MALSDMALPSYQSIILRDGDLGALIAPYLDQASLRSLLLADKQCYKAFVRHLWNDPIKWVVVTRAPFSKCASLVRTFTSTYLHYSSQYHGLYGVR